MKTSFFYVTFTAAGSQEQCPLFTSLRAAQKHARWLRAQSWAADVAVWVGEVGGILAK